MTGFHAHRHTSLLTCLRTHRLPCLVPTQHPETEAGLLPAQVHLNVLVLRSYETQPQTTLESFNLTLSSGYVQFVFLTMQR